MATAVMLACGMPSVAAAQTVRVVNSIVDHAPDGCHDELAGDCTLREAVEQDAADVIELPHDVYALERGPLDVDRAVTIRGTGVGLATLTRGDPELDMRIMTVGSDGLVDLDRLEIAGGFTTLNGGGVFVAAGAHVVVTDSEIVGNTAHSGGGIWAEGAITLVRSTVAFNAAQGDIELGAGQGGGIAIAGVGTPATLVNTTVSGNATSGQGGGIYTERSLFLQNVSIVDNAAPPRVGQIGNGGGLFQSFPPSSGRSTTAKNTLLARNENGGCGGTVNDPILSDNGLIDEPLPNTTCNAVGNDNLIVPDAMVGDLLDNGGPTRTHALLDGSPAIDAGAACEFEDQRGFPRPIGPACDIGAYEASSLPPVNTFADDEPDGCDTDHCTLRERVEEAAGGDVILLEPGRYELTRGELYLHRDVIIVGAGARETTIDANGLSRIGYVEEGADVIVVDLTATAGDARPAINIDPGHGGAFRVGGAGSLELFSTALTGNVASLTGGAVSNAGWLAVVASLAAGNRVEGDDSARGGAIFSDGGGAAVYNSTISGNRADAAGPSRGGGLYIADESALAHATITNNAADDVGGLYDASGQSVIWGTIVAGNVGDECGDPSIDQTFELYNLADDESCVFDGEGDRQGVDPRLGPLADNGGPTDTHALLAGSPAIDAVATDYCFATDQRGALRDPGACDAGAYEAGAGAPQPPPSPPGGSQNNNQQPPQQSQPDQLPPPKAGETVNALPSQGTVRIRLPGTNRFVVLAAGDQLPVGTVVDTTKGQVTLVAAGGQQATFYDGIFKIGQGKGAKPLTTLTLVEKLSCPKRGKASAAAKKKKRRLWGNGSGKFRTQGQFSSATVRGTKWLVEDRCDSTVTKVRTGRVAVRDFVKRKTVIVRAGKQYVAKRRR